jgi:predicted  nucleic acid-binding Zn-ribbon protein
VYESYNLNQLKKQYKRLKWTVSNNRKEIYKRVKEIEELQQAILLNNRDIKSLKREIKKRRRERDGVSKGDQKTG